MLFRQLNVSAMPQTNEFEKPRLTANKKANGGDGLLFGIEMLDPKIFVPDEYVLVRSHDVRVQESFRIPPEIKKQQSVNKFGPCSGNQLPTNNLSISPFRLLSGAHMNSPLRPLELIPLPCSSVVVEQ